MTRIDIRIFVKSFNNEHTGRQAGDVQRQVSKTKTAN